MNCEIQSQRIRPKNLGLYLTRQCNLSCPSCLFRLQKRNFHKDVNLPFNQAVKIINYYNSLNVQNVALQSEGELFLYERYWELVSFCQKNEISLQNTVTNGILIDKFLLKIIQNFNSISISVDGYDTDSYRKRRGGNVDIFNRIISNTRLLLRESKKLKKEFKVIYNCVIMANNYMIMPKMIEMAETLGIYKIQFRNMHRYDPSNDLLSPIYNTPELIEFIEKLKSKRYTVHIKWPEIYGLTTQFHCSMLFGTVTIGSDGFFAPCCHIPSNPSYGYFFDDPLGFNSKNMAMFRRTFINSKTIKELPMQCRECPRLTNCNDKK
ncbi:radical SAM protein [uncultured Desulfosarcina sp.]|uniref:radical SAM protein n=1 Tax=uncultured Desulfosarcina sp. TaxID=218289 RepID=UPI0029C8F65D|nr:radical SAM protein [uncultured Desulfosarcina sp.]